ncbi:MAG: hypothetical protein WA970_13685 [Gammaproteobacteria bacterium]
MIVRDRARNRLAARLQGIEHEKGDPRHEPPSGYALRHGPDRANGHELNDL